MITTAPCPHCGSPRPIVNHITGDVVLCSDCGGWYQVQHRVGGTVLLPWGRPPAAPPERRKPRRRN